MFPRVQEVTIVQHNASSKGDARGALPVPEEPGREHALEDLGQLTAAVVHDVNNQLTAILCAVPLLSRSVADNETASMLANEIRGAAERAAELTRRALAVTRPRPAQREAANLSACVAEARELIELAAGRRVELTLALEPNVGEAQFERDELDHVLLHLAACARERMPRGGKLTIATYDAPVGATSPEYVALAISDTGEEVPPDTRERIFQRLDASARSGKAGWLGLAAAYSFAKRSGGCISLHNVPGQGTRVVVYLPRL
jgi:signal transduction histidine kinase